MPTIHQWFTAHYDVLKDFSGPVATIIASVVAVILTTRLGTGQLRIAEAQKNIALQQAHLADVRLQHDLYDRRYKIYDAALALAIETSIEAKISPEAFRAYVRGTADGIFLLDAELIQYIEEIRLRAIRLQFLKDVINLPDYAAQRSALIDEEARLLIWFNDQILGLRERFKRFLALDHNVNRYSATSSTRT